MMHAGATLLLFTVYIVVGLAAGSLGPAIPGFAEATGETAGRIGMLFIFYRIGYISGSLGGGRVIDAWGAGRLTSWLAFLIAASLSLLSFAANLPLLFAAILLLGLGLGATEVSSQTNLIRLHGERVGPCMNGLHLMYCVGAIIAPLLVAFFYSRRDLPTAFRLIALAAALVAFAALRRRGEAGIAEKSETVFAKAPVSMIAFLAAGLLFTGAAESSLAGWLYSYALAETGAGERFAGILTSSFWLTMTVGRLAGVWLVRKAGAFRLLLWSSGAAVFSMAGLLVSGSLPSLWITIVLAGLFEASVVPLVFTFAGEKKIASGPIVGFFVVACSCGGMVFPPLLGAFMQRHGFGLFAPGIAVLQLAAFLAFAAVFFMRKKF